MATNYSDVTNLALKIRAIVGTVNLPSSEADELFEAYAQLAIDRGQHVTDEDVHNAWAIWAAKFEPGNQWLVPYDQLPKDAMLKDAKFTAAIRKVARAS